MAIADAEMAGAIDRWRSDPIAFIREALVNPETGRPFDLFPAQERFLREAFTPGPDGRLPYPETIFGAPKKSGKTTTAAFATLYVVVVLGGPFAEGYCLANDLEQSVGRVFQAIVRIIEASPLLRRAAVITGTRVVFPGSGATIPAIASDYAGAAGGNPSISTFDELWAFMSERSRRLWDEMVPVPTRQVSCRLTVTYAGFEHESALLEDLYKRGMQGEEIAPNLRRVPGELLMFWSHEPVAPWQTASWIEQMRRALRPSAFIRMIQNRFVSGEEIFIPLEWWDACVDPEARPIVADPYLPVWGGVDASTKRDSTALVLCAWDTAKRVRLVAHRIFQPTPQSPLDFEGTIEATLLDWHRRFLLRGVRYDPTQMVRSAQTLVRAGVPMVEFPQSVPNLTEASQNLYDVLKARGLVVYADEELRRAISRAIAVSTPRGWRIAKEKASHKIDSVVALAQAALGAVREGSEEIGDVKSLVSVSNNRTTASSPFGPYGERREQGHRDSADWPTPPWYR